MKKLIILILFCFLLIACTDTLKKDPSLKESERIALLQKAKTDTLTTVVEMDNSYYFIKDNKVEGQLLKESGDLGMGIFLGIVIMMILISIMKAATD